MSDHVDKLHGGKADGMQPKDFPRKALKKGMQHEKEHTTNEGIAKEIAMDHLAEDPRYYQKIDMVEKTAMLQGLLDELGSIFKEQE